MTNRGLEELEVKVAFLEDSLSKMSEEFYIQQRELDDLKAKYARLMAKLREAQSGDADSFASQDERPPHY